MFAEQGAVGLGGVLRTSIRMVDASGWRVAAFDRRCQRGKSEPGIDPPADRVACDAARPRMVVSQGVVCKRNKQNWSESWD